jgi:predicted alpha/beta hydrolase family esterase
MMQTTVIICPGNGCTDIRNSNWYGDLFELLEGKGITCVCENFPDPHHARRDIWVPFMRSLAEKHAAGREKEVVLIGHSSGAQAALRYSEMYPLHGCVLVSATYSDLGDPHERASGYYPQMGRDTEESNPYLFSEMKNNCKHWYQLHSDDDPFIPVYEAEAIRNGLGLRDDQYRVLSGRSHFFEFQPEILEAVESLCSNCY